MAPSEGVRFKSQYSQQRRELSDGQAQAQARCAAERRERLRRLPEWERSSEADAPLALDIVASSMGCGGGRMARPAAVPPWPRPLPRPG
eukprot:COSAG04_NODE_20667_length_388_cov_43.989619_1_plen_88_part_01